MKFIVIVGTVCGNKTFHGPFNSEREASLWTDENVQGQVSEIVPIQSP